MSSFEKKVLRLTFTLATGNFGASNANRLTIDGLRTACNISNAGGQAMGVASGHIYGMRQSDMNQLTMLAWKPFDVQRNTITIEAGDIGTTLTTVFQGTILNAWTDYHASPDVFFYFDAQAQYYDQINPVPPLSFEGSAGAASMMEVLAKSMGLAFENNGVTAQLANAYYPGTAIDQARAIARDANLDLYIENSVMAIAPKGVPRVGLVPIINSNSGLVGYPTFDKNGITFSSVFNPAIRFGGQVEMQSDVIPANGKWWANSIGHRLEANRPDGAWFTDVKATSFQFPVLPRG